MKNYGKTAVLQLQLTIRNMLFYPLQAYEERQQRAQYSKQLFNKRISTNKITEMGYFVFHPTGNSHFSKLDRK